MNELKPSVHDEANGLDYVLVGDYYILTLTYLQIHNPKSRSRKVVQTTTE